MNSIELLDELIPRYAENKSDMDSLKKLVEKDNKEIKQIFADCDLCEYEHNGYIAKQTISRRESLNEEKLLKLFQENESEIPPGIIKVKPYIDIEELENALYHEDIPHDILVKMDECRDVKEVVTLKVSRKKVG